MNSKNRLFAYRVSFLILVTVGLICHACKADLRLLAMVWLAAGATAFYFFTVGHDGFRKWDAIKIGFCLLLGFIGPIALAFLSIGGLRHVDNPDEFLVR